MDFQTFRQFVADEAAKLHIEEYELYYQLEESTSVSVFRHEVNRFSDSGEGGVCLRCLHFSNFLCILNQPFLVLLAHIVNFDPA